MCQEIAFFLNIAKDPVPSIRPPHLIRLNPSQCSNRHWLPAQCGVMSDHSIGRIDSEYSTSEPNSPDPVLESYFRQQLEKLYADPSEASAASDGTQNDKNDQAIAENARDDDGEEYEFHLFRRSLVSGPALIGTSSGPQRIALRSPSPAGDGPHFVNGGRLDEYYFSGDTSAERAEQYAQAAVSEQDIISGLKVKWVC